MDILRLSTLSLALAVAVFALGYANPSFADNPKKGDCSPEHCDHGGEDPPSGLTYQVDLRGPIFGTPADRGAFEFDVAGSTSNKDATLDSKGLALTGGEVVDLKRALNLSICTSGTDADDRAACSVWNNVFNLCGLLGPYAGGGSDDTSGPTNLNTFRVEIGDWSVSNSSEEEWISFGFEIPASFSDRTDRPLSAFLTLSAPCTFPCGTIPTTTGTFNFLVTKASIHLRGKAGVTHKADCHADFDDPLLASGSQVVITVTN